MSAASSYLVYVPLTDEQITTVIKREFDNNNHLFACFQLKQYEGIVSLRNGFYLTVCLDIRTFGYVPHKQFLQMLQQYIETTYDCQYSISKQIADATKYIISVSLTFRTKFSVSATTFVE